MTVVAAAGRPVSPHPQEPLGLRLRGIRNRGGGRFADFSFFGHLMHKKQII